MRYVLKYVIEIPDDSYAAPFDPSKRMLIIDSTVNQMIQDNLDIKLIDKEIGEAVIRS